MKRQRGQALILVLILLAVGALVIVPVLRYTNTGLRSQRISEDVMANQFAADAAVEDALWQMLNGALVLLDPETHREDTYEVEFDFGRFPYTIQIPSIPESEWVKTSQIWVKVEVQPNWVEADAGEITFTYIFRINMPVWDLSNFGFSLPSGLTYVPDSTRYIGPEKHNLLDSDAEVSSDGTMVLMNGQWELMMAEPAYVEIDEGYEGPYEDGTSYLLITPPLEQGEKETLQWMPYFTNPQTGKPPTGRRVLIQTCQAFGDPGWGIHYVEPSFTGNFGTVVTGQTGALGVAMYNIIIVIEGVTYQVVVAYDTSVQPPEPKIISYQIVE